MAVVMQTPLAFAAVSYFSHAQTSLRDNIPAQYIGETSLVSFFPIFFIKAATAIIRGVRVAPCRIRKKTTLHS